MNQWVETIDGKSYWFQQFSKAEMVLLKKYHIAISRMTKMDLRGIL
jgi:hypothetical protein